MNPNEDKIERWRERWAQTPGPTEEDARFLRQTFGLIEMPKARRLKRAA